jgi:membrane-associated phospholipid phosphatase
MPYTITTLLETPLSHIRASIVCAVTAVCLHLPSPVFAQAQPPDSPKPGVFSRMFQTTIEDFRRLPSQDTLMVLSIGGAIAASGRPKDWDVTHSFSASGARSTYEPGATIGGARVQFAAALATYTVGRVTRNRRVAGVGTDLIRAQLVAQTITAGIKLSARRHRPDGDEFSFPSGHSSVTFATATVLQRNFGWKAGIPAYALASYVAASRVHMKRHFFSDVTFGAAIGIVAGRTVTVGRGRARFAVAPTVSANQAGVSFVLLDQ